MTFGSLFSGIGGFDLGFERAGWTCAWQIEIDPFCRQVLAARFPGVKQFEDITKTPSQSLADVDALIGGFPCQDLSQAGKRAGIKGARSGLWFEYARIIGDLRPRIVVIENVPGLLVPGAIGRVVGELARLGYVGCWRSVRAAELGASHLRKRVFIVAKLADSAIELRRREHIDLSGRAIPAGARASSAADQLADSLRELEQGRRDPLAESGPRKSRRGEYSGGCGKLAHAGLSEHGRAEEPAELNRQGTPDDDSRAGREQLIPDSEGTRLPDSDLEAVQPARRRPEGRGLEQLRRAPAAMADSDGVGCRQRGQSSQSNTRDELIDGCYLSFAPGPSDPRWPRIIADRPDLAPALPKAAKPAVRGVADGVSYPLDGALSDRTKRLRALGNAVVPQIAEWIAERINSL